MNNTTVPDPMPNASSEPLRRIFARPEGQLRSLSVRYRWEFTRRHPYYLETWENFTREISTHDEAALSYEVYYLALLNAISVSGPPVAPDTPLQTLLGRVTGPTPGWLCGSVQPLSIRGLVGLLLRSLSPEARRRVANLFRQSVADDNDLTMSQFESLVELTKLGSGEFDTYIDQPIVAVSPVVTVNALISDLRDFLDDWRQRRGLVEQRIRLDKFDEYLAVWDACECWTGSGYEPGDQRRLIAVAEQLGIPQSTARNQYRAAFEWITGHPYSLATWLQIFGRIKFPMDAITDITQAVMRRRVRPRQSHRETPESISTPSAREIVGTGFTPAVNNDELVMNQIFEDVKTLLRLGRSDPEIAEELSLRLNTVRLLRTHVENV